MKTKDYSMREMVIECTWGQEWCVSLGDRSCVMFGRDKFLVEKSGNKSVTFLIFVYYNRWKRLDV